MEVRAVDEMMDECQALLQEHDEIGVATGVVRSKQDALTTSLRTIFLKLRDMRPNEYRLARFYRTQWCGADTYAAALEDVLRKLDVPLPCPPADDNDLEVLFKDRDPPTVAGLWAR